VPDARAAIAIALAVWTPIYGEKMIASEKPYVATLEDGKGTVIGSSPDTMAAGGVALVEIAQSDGRILRVTHGR
jgi:hypothetical protein